MNDLVHYLLERGLLDRRAIVDGDVIVFAGTRRHRNFSVVRRGAEGLFVKQIRPEQPNSAHTLQREAACYALLESVPETRALVPRFRSYDATRNMLVVERIEGETMNPQSTAAARRLGRLLARFHDVSRRKLLPRADATLFPGQPPWILSFHHTPLASLQSLGAASAQFVTILQSNPAFGRALDRVRALWRRNALIHGDLKVENVIVSDDVVHIVDWEVADVGDFAWDVGSMLAQGVAPAFLDAYALDDADRGRAMAYAGARMLQSAYEAIAWAQSIAPDTLSRMQRSLEAMSHA